MKKIKIKFSSPKINKKKTLSLIGNSLEKNFPNEGDNTRKFEKHISKLLKSKYVVATTSGTVSIFLALKALDIKPEHEVLVPNITFPATANAVKLAGAKVVLVDVNKNDLLMSFEDLKKKITKKTKAIIPVHVSGRAGGIRKIVQFAKSKKIKVIEDAAEAFMSKSGKDFLGTMGDIGCFSFAPNKIITTGQGGIVVTNQKKIFLKINKLRDQGRTRISSKGDDNYETVGFNFKFTDLQAGLGLSQLKDIKKRIKSLKRNFYYYKKYINQNNDISLIGFNIKNGELPLWTDIKCKNRKKLHELLKKHGIISRYFWRPINTCKPYKTSFNKLKNSKKLSGGLLWLPSSLDMNEKKIFEVCKHINNFYNLRK